MQCINCKKNISKGITSGAGTQATTTPTGIMTDSTPATSTGDSVNHRPNGAFPKTKKYGMTNTPSLLDQQRRKNSCPHCGTPFPRCVICLLPLGTSGLPFVIHGVESENDREHMHDNSSLQEDTISNNGETGDSPKYIEAKAYRRKKERLNEWFSFCLSCNHGMHAGHAEEWFERHNICPAPGCACQCNK